MTEGYQPDYQKTWIFSTQEIPQHLEKPPG